MQHKTILIYRSQTGFTRKYAEMIARETGCMLMEFGRMNASSLSAYDTVVFGTRLHAGMLDGLKKMRKVYARSGASRLIIFATGATPNAAEDVIEEAWRNNLSEDELSAIPHFYMQAGLNYERMGFIDRTMMKVVSAIMKRKKDKTEQEKGFAQAIEKSFDISNAQYIQPLVELIKNS